MAGVHTDVPFGIELGEQLTEPERAEVLELLRKHALVFETNPIRLANTTLCEHVIDTSNHKPIHISMYRYSQVEQEIIDREVQMMLSVGIVGIE